MPRGADYDNGVPQSDNPIEVTPGDHKAHGTNPGSDVDRSYKAAALPEVMGANNLASGGGSRGMGSGKSGGRGPKTMGEKKGRGALGYS